MMKQFFIVIIAVIAILAAMQLSALQQARMLEIMGKLPQRSPDRGIDPPSVHL